MMTPTSPFQFSGVDGTVFALQAGTDDASIVYAVNGGPPLTYTAPFTVPNAGMLSVTAWAELPSGDTSVTVSWEYLLSGACAGAAGAGAVCWPSCSNPH